MSYRFSYLFRPSFSDVSVRRVSGIISRDVIARNKISLLSFLETFKPTFERARARNRCSYRSDKYSYYLVFAAKYPLRDTVRAIFARNNYPIHIDPIIANPSVDPIRNAIISFRFPRRRTTRVDEANLEKKKAVSVTKGGLDLKSGLTRVTGHPLEANEVSFGSILGLRATSCPLSPRKTQPFTH